MDFQRESHDFHGLSILVKPPSAWKQCLSYYDGLLHARVMHIHKGAINHSLSSSILYTTSLLVASGSFKHENEYKFLHGYDVMNLII